MSLAADSNILSAPYRHGPDSCTDILWNLAPAWTGLRSRFSPPSVQLRLRPCALRTFTILTSAPNERMQTIQNRMPLVAPTVWLDRGVGDVSDLLRPVPAEQMTAYPVSTRVNAVKNDGPELIEASG